MKKLIVAIMMVLLVAGSAVASPFTQHEEAMRAARQTNFYLFIFIVPLIFVGWFAVIVTDKARVRSYFENKGCKIINIAWRLFGHGWMAESSKEGGGNRIYMVDYTDDAGNTRSAWCKTAWLGGVYLADDRIVKPGPAGSPLDKDLEIQRLKTENEALKRQYQGTAG